MSKKLVDASELLNRYAAGERDFSNIYIEGSDELASTNLSGIILNGAVVAEMLLDNINLSASKLRETDFGQASLYGANLCGVDLTRANLRYAVLDSANLSDACLVDAHLKGASMGNVNFTRCNLSGAKLSENPWFEGAIFCNTTMPDGSIRTNNT
ncbi:pentapeptide repeat domain protein [Nostoc commune NIES-4072]|uniref:Pentapeptide repeat domain protein n=1 Tax=Nostoc commune NIES-4072 TaxID=2005467 RepID=A0A2R5FIF1_NOSCO|nr:pentapeptide repeat-containing protein [Nostoc commune]BBD65518.1 pentapeptide repeat domain protein [Nostoc commune HK-02]GBG17158.1 pentapeptide repeat domain protein [Nostoc commune NIES-4072]